MIICFSRRRVHDSFYLISSNVQCASNVCRSNHLARPFAIGLLLISVPCQRFAHRFKPFSFILNLIQPIVIMYSTKYSTYRVIQLLIQDTNHGITPIFQKYQEVFKLWIQTHVQKDEESFKACIPTVVYGGSSAASPPPTHYA